MPVHIVVRCGNVNAKRLVVGVGRLIAFRMGEMFRAIYRVEGSSGIVLLLKLFNINVTEKDEFT